MNASCTTSSASCPEPRSIRRANATSWLRKRRWISVKAASSPARKRATRSSSERLMRGAEIMRAPCEGSVIARSRRVVALRAPPGSHLRPLGVTIIHLGGLHPPMWEAQRPMQKTDRSPLAAHAATPAELRERIEAERAGVPFLVLRDGDGAQRLFVLDPAIDRVAIGRSPGNDIALQWDTEVSRLHAELE